MKHAASPRAQIASPKHIKHIAHALTLAPLALAISIAHAAGPLPEGGQIVAGSGSINQQGQALTVHQSTNKLAVDWQSFSVGQGHTVNFVQPSSDAVAMNRVLGADVSHIQGSINANGHVFLINPNGILFTPTAQVNVGGIVASTLGMSQTDFMNGTYRFEGQSSQAIVNQGLLRAAQGGTVALVAARIENTGQIHASQGHVLMGAGQRVRIDLDGPVAIEVEEGALNAVINQHGLIRADGGLVYLSAKAAGDLASAAINHTGITEARTLSSGEQGEIWLMGDMERGAVSVDGTLDASAPNGGDGGFIETSAAKVRVARTAHVNTLASVGATGNWLIDPHDYIIAATGGDITGTQLGHNLASTNMTIQSTDGAGGTYGDIFVNDAVSWSSANTLTLNARRNINFNANLTATQGTLRLYYGQGALNNSTSAVNPSRVYINDGAVISLSAGQHFYTKLGSDGPEVAWTVITALGQANSSDDGTLQGINGRPNSNYVLGADIDASPTLNWNNGAGFMPLGETNLNSVFSGRFDGLGHVIDRLHINRPNESWVGFIGINDPTGEAFPWSSNGSPTDNPQIANLGLTNINVIGGSTVGAFAGEIRNASISNVYATGTVYSTSSRIGGLVGNNKYGVVIDSYAIVNVTGGRGTGGLVGEFEGQAYITNSYASGTVTKANEWDSNIGGLIGSEGWSQEHVGVTHSYYNSTVNASTAMADKDKFGKSATDLTTTAAAQWHAATWNTSGPLPTLKRYVAIPVYGQPVVGQSNPDAQPISLSYNLGSLDGPLLYTGRNRLLSSLWSASSLFGDDYSSWQVGTDYAFRYSGNTVVGFTNAGSYTNITVDILKSGYAAASTGNTAGSLTINPLAITVAADALSKQLGQSDPSLTWQITTGHLASGDNLLGSLTRQSGEDVGLYAITQGTLLNQNYEISFLGANLTILGTNTSSPTPDTGTTLAPAITVAQQTAVSGGTSTAPPITLAPSADGGGGLAPSASVSGSGGLTFVAVSGDAPSADGSSPSGGQTSDGNQGGVDPLGFMRVFVVNGGLKLP